MYLSCNSILQSIWVFRSKGAKFGITANPGKKRVFEKLPISKMLQKIIKSCHKFVAHLEPEGVLLITVGDRYGEVVGRVGVEEVYHASFSFETYEKILANLQVRVLDFVRNDPDRGMASVLLAQRES